MLVQTVLSVFPAAPACPITLASAAALVPLQRFSLFPKGTIRISEERWEFEKPPRDLKWFPEKYSPRGEDYTSTLVLCSIKSWLYKIQLSQTFLTCLLLTLLPYTAEYCESRKWTKTCTKDMYLFFFEIPLFFSRGTTVSMYMWFSRGKCNGQVRQALEASSSWQQNLILFQEAMSQLPAVCPTHWPAIVGEPQISSDFPLHIPAFCQCMSHSEIMRTSARQKAYSLRNVVRDGKGLGSWWHGWAIYTPSSWFKKQINPCQLKPLSADYIPNWYNWSMGEICLEGKDNNKISLVFPIILYSCQLHLFPPTLVYKLRDILCVNFIPNCGLNLVLWTLSPYLYPFHGLPAPHLTYMVHVICDNS